MPRDPSSKNPFSAIDAERSYSSGWNVVTETQRELFYALVREGKIKFHICLAGDSGSGRTNTLRAVHEALSMGRWTDRQYVAIYTEESYLSLQSVFGRLYSASTADVLSELIRNDERSFVVFADYPFRYIGRDLEASVQFLLTAREYSNLSVIFSVSATQLAAIMDANRLLDGYRTIAIAPMRKEELNMMIAKRMNFASSAGRTTDSGNELEITRDALEYIYAVSGGNPRSALITASTLYDKGRENNCRMIDDALVALVSAQNGYVLEGNGCVLRTGLSKLMEIILDRFSLDGVLEHSILEYMHDNFGWDFNITRLRLRTLVKMKLIMEEFTPKKGWFRQYSVR